MLAEARRRRPGNRPGRTRGSNGRCERRWERESMRCARRRRTSRTSLLCCGTGHLRRFCSRSCEAEAGRRQGVIAPVRVVLAAAPLFLDVGNLAVGRDLTVVTGHASASECGESEETNKAHHARLPTDAEQVLYRRVAADAPGTHPH